MMDRSFDFKRRANYWYGILGPSVDDATSVHTDHSAVDRFSIISSSVFTQLKTLDSLIAPYSISPFNTVAGRDVVGGYVQLPHNQNIVNFIHSKRGLFSQTDIKDIVHDARIAGDLIKQMKAGIEEQPKKMKPNMSSKHLQEHRLGVIACLQYILKSVQTAVEEYERYRLNTETQMNGILSLIRENQIKSSKLEANDASIGTNKSFIAGNYVRLFVDNSRKGDMKDDANSSILKNDDGKVSGQSSPKLTSSKTDLINLTGIPERKSQLPMYQRYTDMDNIEPPREEDMQILQQEHKTLVSRVHESMQMSELKTISNVQQRLSEISTMFEQFSGTLAVQLDMFESINANVMESLSNIETTEDTLQKANKENIPYHQLLMCYAFVGAAIFLLLVDYLKSHRGNYIL